MYGPPKLRRVLELLWDHEPQNTNHGSDIVCLGSRYSSSIPDHMTTDSTKTLDTTAPSTSEQQEASTSKSPTPTDKQNLNDWPSEFLDDVGSRIWFTYRTNFPLIPKSRKGPSPVTIGGILRGSGIDLNGFTSDVGWGCMIRTSQSLLANSISILTLGRNWRYQDDIDPTYKSIISLFTDDPKAPFSLHNFVKNGEANCGKMPGEWFGPSAAASSIKVLQEQFSQSVDETSDQELPYRSLKVFISSGSDLYENHFLKTAVNSETGDFQPTLILLGLRLGIDKVNKVYWPSIKAYFDSTQAVGIAGGRPSSSHYFYGYQGEYLFYLDPHYPKAALTPDSLNKESLETVHTRRIRMLNLCEMDPSMLMGVLIKDKEDWENWKRSVESTPLQSIIHISPEPIAIRRSSVSVSNDDDSDFIDVLLEQDDDDIITESEDEMKTYDTVKKGDDEPIVVVSDSNTSKASDNKPGDKTKDINREVVEPDYDSCPEVSNSIMTTEDSVIVVPETDDNESLIDHSFSSGEKVVKEDDEEFIHTPKLSSSILSHKDSAESYQDLNFSVDPKDDEYQKLSFSVDNITLKQENEDVSEVKAKEHASNETKDDTKSSNTENTELKTSGKIDISEKRIPHEQSSSSNEEEYQSVSIPGSSSTTSSTFLVDPVSKDSTFKSLGYVSENEASSSFKDLTFHPDESIFDFKKIDPSQIEQKHSNLFNSKNEEDWEYMKRSAGALEEGKLDCSKVLTQSNQNDNKSS